MDKHFHQRANSLCFCTLRFCTNSFQALWEDCRKKPCHKKRDDLHWKGSFINPCTRWRGEVTGCTRSHRRGLVRTEVQKHIEVSKHSQRRPKMPPPLQTLVTYQTSMGEGSQAHAYHCYFPTQMAGNHLKLTGKDSKIKSPFTAPS